MQRVDAAYVYELGAKLRSITSLKEESTNRSQIHYVVGPAIEAIESFLGSIFVPHVRAAHASARALLSALNEIKIDFSDFNTFGLEVPVWDITDVRDKFRAFEAILLAELQGFPLYLVFGKGGFDVICLTDTAVSLFPSSLVGKCPEAIDDVQMGARCMAFELWTAMGFHFHRANEAILRRYYSLVIGDRNKPKMLTMGTMVSSMNQHQVGDANIRAALQNIIVFHRNPIAHPDHRIVDADEALSLYAAIRACMGYMLNHLPQGKSDAVAAMAPPLITAAPPA